MLSGPGQLTSWSWRRDALACAITGHASEAILRALAERASQAGLEPSTAIQLRAAADDMARAWKAWRVVTGQWDVLTTGAPRGTGLSPVAAEVGDLALLTGRSPTVTCTGSRPAATRRSSATVVVGSWFGSYWRAASDTLPPDRHRT